MRKACVQNSLPSLDICRPCRWNPPFDGISSPGNVTRLTCVNAHFLMPPLPGRYFYQHYTIIHGNEPILCDLGNAPPRSKLLTNHPLLRRKILTGTRNSPGPLSSRLQESAGLPAPLSRRGIKSGLTNVFRIKRIHGRKKPGDFSATLPPDTGPHFWF